ncbi:MAG TPA: DUF998 domain-containing protein [Candidatus Binatia bacterium]|nr:DUF998 domain-containing protein [Candidatus Binatia bacterium]
MRGWRRLRRSFLGPCAVAAAALHVGSVVLAGMLTRDYDPGARAISELGMIGQPSRTLVSFGGMMLPGALIVLTAALAWGLPELSRAARTGLAALGAAGASLVVAGLVPFPSPIHLAAALAAGSGCAMALAAFSPWAARRLGSSAWKTSGLACACLLAVDVVAWVLAEGLARPPHGAMGLEQRAASFAGFAWWALCARALGRRHRAG